MKINQPLNKRFLSALVLIYSVGLIISLGNPNLWEDELDFHYPLTEKFLNEYPYFDFKNNYTSASTPLPYLIIATLSKVIPLSTYSVRIYTALVSFFSLLVLIRILKSMGIEQYKEVTLLLLFQPYFFANSFIFKMSIWGIFFGLLGFYYLIQEKDNKNGFLCGLFFALAVLSRQFYAVLPIAVFVSILYNRFRANERISIAYVATFLIPFILPAILFLYWGSIASPDYRHHTIGIKPENMFFFFVLPGAYYGWILLTYKSINPKILLVLILLVPGYFFIPSWSTAPAETGISGMVMHVIDIIDSTIPGIETILLFALAGCGLVLVTSRTIEILTDQSYKMFLALIVLNVLGVAMLLNMRSGERHFMSILPYFILVLSPKISGKIALAAIIVLAGLSFYYLYYLIYLKF